MSSNDNDPASPDFSAVSRDAHGHAALLLVESLIHGLCERSTLTADDAVEIVERALEIQQEVALGADGAAEPMWQSHALLSSIASSLKADGEYRPRPA